MARPRTLSAEDRARRRLERVREVITVRVRYGQRVELERRATQCETSMNALIRAAIDTYFQEAASR